MLWIEYGAIQCARTDAPSHSNYTIIRCGDTQFLDDNCNSIAPLVMSQHPPDPCPGG